jgi:dipeptidyl-peptidase 4
MKTRFCISAAALAAVLSVPISVASQQRLPEMPRYDRYQEVSANVRQIGQNLATGRVEWDDDSRGVQFRINGETYRFDLSTEASVVSPPEEGGAPRRGRPARGRQFTEAASPDSSRKAFYRDRNLFISSIDGSDEVAVTTDGSAEHRIKYGTASWVYGEELGQSTAIWWSPDGTRLAYYRFDESPVPDYFLQMDQTKLQSTIDTEAYPKAGVDNPIVELFVFDVASGEHTKIDVRDGQPLTDDVIGHYVYNVRWSPDGTEIHFNRTNRRQNVMEFTACDPEDGSCRVVVHEERLTSWTENRPALRYLEDKTRFIWESARNGWTNFYLYNLDGELLETLTQHDSFEVGSVVRVDETERVMYYTARSGDNHMKMQLHRVRLDGTHDERLTDQALTHDVTFSPDGTSFVDVAQTHDIAPVVTLRNTKGEALHELGRADLTAFDEAGLQRVEMFTFTSADGVTELYGMLHKPSDFDPTRSYPVIVSTYNGPRTNGARERFAVPHRFTELGFLYVTLDARSADGMGKAILDQLYLNMGIVEVDDLAAGVRALNQRNYVNGDRVGIYGTSYGGYTSLLSLLRHPDTFAAASASSPVTDWRNYDTIYTERFMYTPQVNTAGYDAGSAMTYAEDLEGDLLIYYGTADNNVHPSNSLQLITALQKAGKSFEVQVGPDRGHTSVNQDRMMEFFIENLILAKDGTIF